MNYKSFMKASGLTEDALEEIKGAVKKAESRTTGEIALAITPESSSYAFWELASSVVASFILIVCLLPLSSLLYSWMESVLWEVKPWYLVACYITVAVVMVVFLYILFNIPAIDYLVVPGEAKNTNVTARALRYFTESGVYDTREHSGILIFVSFFERQVRIVADKGISEKISQDLWNLIADEMVEDLSHGRTKEAFLGAIKRCEELLAENFPPHEDNPNELKDGLVILEADRWV